VQFDNDELRGAVDGDKQMELTLLGSELGDHPSFGVCTGKRTRRTGPIRT
jgi:hypothetical protein